MNLPRIILTAALVAPFAVSAAPPAAQVLVDGSGITLGPVVAEVDDPSILGLTYSVGNIPLKLLFTDNVPRDTNTRVPLLYESADCTGPAMLALPSENDTARNAVVFATAVYWPHGSGRDLTLRSAGWFVRDGQECIAARVGQNLCCAPLPQAESLRVAPAAGTDLTSLHLTSPFHVEAAQ